MKKSLLLLSNILLFSAINMNAQVNLNADKIWDFGNDSFWTGYAGATAGAVVDIRDNIGVFPHSNSTSLMGQVVANNSAAGFADGYTYIQRMQFNGSSNNSGILPTQRYLTFKAAGACNIRIWVKASAASRTAYLSDGATVLASGTTADSATGVIIEYNYAGTTAKTFYISNDASMYIYKVDVDFPPFATLSTADLKTKETEQIFSSQNKISVRNIKSKTDFTVYNMNGALVKSKSISSDEDFEMTSGVYIVNLKTAQGKTSKKVIIK